MAGLRRLAIEGLVALPKRGVEVGGIVVGRASGTELQIEGFEEVRCEHKYGPSYALSDADRDALSKLLEQRRKGALPVVGFFRSFTSRSPMVEEADEIFVRQRFPKGNFVFLMLRPLSVESCLASFRYCVDGRLLPDTEDPPFQFDFSQMPPMEPAPEPVPEIPQEPQPSQIAQPPTMAGPVPIPKFAPVPKLAPVPKPVRVPEPVPVPEPPHLEVQLPAQPKVWERYGTMEMPASQSQPRRKFGQWAVAAGIGLLLGVSGAALYKSRIGPPQPEWAELHLDVHPESGQLRVTWDGNAPSALTATRGLLAVTHGDNHQDVPLNSQEVRAGHYTLMPTPGDLGVRLILYDNAHGVAGDSVHVAGDSARVTNVAKVDTASSPSSARTPEVPASPKPAASVPAEPARRAVVPPSAVFEVQPAIPEGIRSRINDRIVIPVKLQVSAEGRVEWAVPETHTENGVYLYLADQAKKAARQWRFAPARAGDGTRIAAMKTIEFVFRP